MPEIGTATVKVVPDMTEMKDALEAKPSGFSNLCNIIAGLLLICSPALVWAVYGWAF